LSNVKQQVSTHTVYRLEDETVVPSVTTILKLLSTDDSLIYWSNNLGKQRLDYKKTLNSYARKGTFVHELIHENLTGNFDKKVLVDLTENEKSLGYNCMSYYYNFLKENSLEPIFSEEQFVSEKFKFGGTIDFFGKLNGKNTILDFKTSKSFQLKHFIQLSAYRQLITENTDYEIEQIAVLRLNDKSDDYEIYIIDDLTVIDKLFKLFRSLLITNTLKNDIDKVLDL
jgi:hypothetical protein